MQISVENEKNPTKEPWKNITAFKEYLKLKMLKLSIKQKTKELSFHFVFKLM